MPIRFDSLKSAIKHTLGGDPSAGASYARIINGAGRAWTAAQDWYYLAGRLATLTATPGSEWISLPADYMALGTIVPEGDGSTSLILTQPADFIEYSSSGSLNVVSHYVGTVTFREPDDDVPSLRLYPTPTVADTFTLLYDAQWVDVNDDEDVIYIPKFAEHAFEEWVRMYARGMDEEDTMPLMDRMAACKASPMFQDVARRDALSTGAVVHLGRGAAQMARTHYGDWTPPGNVI